MLNKGFYSLYEAHRLTGVPVPSIRRFINGYTTKIDNHERFNDSIMAREYGPIDGQYFINFRELMELKAISLLRSNGLSWKMIREAAVTLSNKFDLTKESYPFSSGNILVDNRGIFLDHESGIANLNEKNSGQYNIKSILQPFLNTVSFDEHRAPIKWSPYESVVVDPLRSRGAPIIDVFGVPTLVLAKSYKVEKSFSQVSSIYEVPEDLIKKAVAFEGSLAA